MLDNVWFWFVLAALATFRIGELVAIDTVFAQVRAVFGRNAAGKAMYTWQWYAAEWINCPYCIGVWVAIIFALLMQPDNIYVFVLYWLGIAGAQAVLQSLVGRVKE